MATQNSVAPPPSVFHVLAVSREDQSLGNHASCEYENLKRNVDESDRAAQKDWTAYQNLMQVLGIMKTARRKDAARVWDAVVDFVDCAEMAGATQPPAKLPKCSNPTELLCVTCNHVGMGAMMVAGGSCWHRDIRHLSA